MANLVKISYLALDLGKFTGTQEHLVDLEDDTDSVIKECRAGRAPPLPPDQFAAILKSKSFAKPKDLANKLGESDQEIVADMYRRAFEARVGAAEDLNYMSLGWGDEEAKVVAGALGTAAACRELELNDNRIGDEGMAALAASLRAGAAPQLAFLDLYGNRIGDEGAAALAASLRAGAAPPREGHGRRDCRRVPNGRFSSLLFTCACGPP